MPGSNCNSSEKEFNRFSIWEKLIMSCLVYSTISVGAWGISLESVPWTFGYLAFVFISMTFLIGYANCTHCRYIWPEYTDCLFWPWGRIYRVIFKYRPAEKFAPLDYVFFYIFFIGNPLFPQYWLLKNKSALILFWLLWSATALAFALHACRKCQHTVCPFNKHPECN
jgi:hypothetical protein